jgi:hypothetical protein
MTDLLSRASARVFAELLLKGQRVDWKYSLVVILVITGMFSTPLALGSIRNRVYVAVKEQIEKENNAREISLQLARDDAPALDERLVAEIEESFPGARAVGNHKLVVSVEGPEGADLLTLQTLAAEDPRQDPLRILPGVPPGFGLTELVASDALGRLLYGERWDELWVDGRFSGPPLKLRINELPLAPELRVVARRTLPGRGLYGSQALGTALRRYTQGFGAPELGLPIDSGLVEHALPRLATASCVLLLDDADPTCGAEGREQLRRRFRELQLEVEPRPALALPAIAGHEAWRIPLSQVIDEGAEARRRESPGDCREILSPHLVDRCGAASIATDLAVSVTLERASGETVPAVVAAAPAEVRRLLPGAAELVDRVGVAPPSPAAAIDLTVPVELGLELAQEVSLRLAAEWVPARVASFYDCPEGGGSCALFADPETVFRLQNLQEGTIEVFSRRPLAFVPTRTDAEFDEVLVYVGRVEDVETVSRDLRSKHPGINVQYNVAALDKLRRQDSRLAALFSITITLSALFIVMALGALARINVERRSRQMAQMLILGFSRRFVRHLIVAEYLLLTVVSSLAALGLTALLCLAARRFLGASADGAERGFEVIVRSMSVDAGAFLQVFAVVTVCTCLIAFVAARKAARTDPLDLLD